MKARVIETGEIIDVTANYYPTIYKEMRQRGREFYEEDLEFLDKPKKMVSLDRVCDWLKEKYNDYANNELGVEYLINDLRGEFE